MPPLTEGGKKDKPKWAKATRPPQSGRPEGAYATPRSISRMKTGAGGRPEQKGRITSREFNGKRALQSREQLWPKKRHKASATKVPVNRGLRENQKQATTTRRKEKEERKGGVKEIQPRRRLHLGIELHCKVRVKRLSRIEYKKKKRGGRQPLQKQEREDGRCNHQRSAVAARGFDEKRPNVLKGTGPPFG